MIYAALRASMIYHCFAMDKKILVAFATRIFWQRNQDLNPDEQSQSLLCYRYTIPLHPCRTALSITQKIAFVKGFSEK